MEIFLPPRIIYFEKRGRGGHVIACAVARSGDPKAMGNEPLVEHARDSARLLFRLANGILRDAQAAEDVCQQAYLAAWENRAKGREPSNLRGWLARVVVNESLQIIRRRKVERRVMVERGAQASGDCQPSHDSGLTLRESVLHAMSRLPEEIRAVVALRIMQGLAGNDVKQILGCSAAEVSRLLHQGLEMLRPALSDFTERSR